MRTLIITILLALPLSLTTACGDDASQCDKVAAHFLDLAPAELKSQLGNQDDLAKKCEKDMSAEERSCALAAKDFGEMMSCRNKK